MQQSKISTERLIIFRPEKAIWHTSTGWNVLFNVLVCWVGRLRVIKAGFMRGIGGVESGMLDRPLQHPRLLPHPPMYTTLLCSTQHCGGCSRGTLTHHCPSIPDFYPQAARRNNFFSWRNHPVSEIILQWRRRGKKTTSQIIKNSPFSEKAEWRRD